MTADPDTVPWRTDAELEADDAEHQAAMAAIKLNQRIADKTDDLRVYEAAKARLRSEQAADTDFTDQYLTRAQLHDLPTPEPLIGRVLPRHTYAILRGRDHSFKSFIAVDWACCLATGKPWQGHTAEPTRVLYIAGEGAHGLAGRIDAWEYAWGRNVPDNMLTLRRSALNLHHPGPAFDHLLELVAAGEYGLVVVDTLRRVSGAADGNSSEMGLVVDNLDRIKQATADGTVLAVAHTDKGDHDTRGYSGIEDDADVVWSAKREDRSMFVSLELAKMKDGPDGRTVHLEAVPTAGSLILAGITGLPPASTTESQVKILDTLRELFPDGAASGVLMRATGLADATYYRAAKQLREAGHVVNIGTITRPHLALPALDTDSHEVPDPDTPSDLHDSHDSHDSQPLLPQTPITPTTLRSGSGDSDGATP